MCKGTSSCKRHNIIIYNIDEVFRINNILYVLNNAAKK